MYSSAIAGKRTRVRAETRGGKEGEKAGAGKEGTPAVKRNAFPNTKRLQLARSTLGLRLLCCCFRITIAQQTPVCRAASWYVNSERNGKEERHVLVLRGKNHEEEHKHPERKITLSV